MTQNQFLLSLRMRVRSDAKAAFASWQTELHQEIAAAPGFVSLEIISPVNSSDEWKIVERFKDEASVSQWNSSSERKLLMEHLLPLLVDQNFYEGKLEKSSWENNVTEVFITHVLPEHECFFRTWIAKIHQCEALFPGFRGVYVQSPSHPQRDDWVTLLQFDTPDHLDRWLASSERKDLLAELKPWVSQPESHRVISPYANWFSNITPSGQTPPVWKQTMIILLVLFPIVMLQFKFLVLLTRGWDISLATFFSNAISVCLISWPLMPLAIKCLKWWLIPSGARIRWITIFGTLLMLLLYISEIVLFWSFV